MDLIALHSIMSRKKYYYFSGSTNTIDNEIYIDFSTGHNGRGNSIDLRIGQKNHDITIETNLSQISLVKLNDSELIQIIEKEFQSKSGDCLMYVYDLKDCPDDTLLNVNRHSPYTCKCGTVFEVDINNRKSIEYDRTK